MVWETGNAVMNGLYKLIVERANNGTGRDALSNDEAKRLFREGRRGAHGLTDVTSPLGGFKTIYNRLHNLAILNLNFIGLGFSIYEGLSEEEARTLSYVGRTRFYTIAPWKLRKLKQSNEISKNSKQTHGVQALERLHELYGEVTMPII